MAGSHLRFFVGEIRATLPGRYMETRTKTCGPIPGGLTPTHTQNVCFLVIPFQENDPQGKWLPTYYMIPCGYLGSTGLL